MVGANLRLTKLCITKKRDCKTRREQAESKVPLRQSNGVLYFTRFSMRLATVAGHDEHGLGTTVKASIGDCISNGRTF